MAEGCVRLFADGRRPGRPTDVGSITGGWIPNPDRWRGCRSMVDRRNSSGKEAASTSPPSLWMGPHFLTRTMGAGSVEFIRACPPDGPGDVIATLAGERLPARIPNMCISPDGAKLAVLLLDGA